MYKRKVGGFILTGSRIIWPWDSFLNTFRRDVLLCSMANHLQTFCSRVFVIQFTHNVICNSVKQYNI